MDPILPFCKEDFNYTDRVTNNNSILHGWVMFESWPPKVNPSHITWHWRLSDVWCLTTQGGMWSVSHDTEGYVVCKSWPHKLGSQPYHMILKIVWCVMPDHTSWDPSCIRWHWRSRVIQLLYPTEHGQDMCIIQTFGLSIDTSIWYLHLILAFDTTL